MRLRLLVLIVLISPLCAQDLRHLTHDQTKPPAVASVPDHKFARRAVGVSIVAVVGAKLADNATSTNCRCYELNPLFRTATGHYDAPKAVLINSMVFAPIIASELLYMRHHPNGALLPGFMVFNGTMAAASGRVSFNNSRIGK